MDVVGSTFSGKTNHRHTHVKMELREIGLQARVELVRAVLRGCEVKWPRWYGRTTRLLSPIALKDR